MTKEQRQAVYACDAHGYVFTYYKDYDFSKITPCVIPYMRKGRSKDTRSINDCIIMADTETSKKSSDPKVIGHNHVVAWTVTLRANGSNLFTLWGHRPDTLVDTLARIHESLKGERTFIFFHNMPYDYVFIRRFLFKAWGLPEKSLNVKSHYPLFMEFKNGIMLRDSLMLAQRKLEKWADDLKVKHQKEVGKWDYDKIRNQNEKFTAEELKYIEHDTLAGVECIDKTMGALHKHIYSLPYTATGIPRGETRIRAKGHRAKDLFDRLVVPWEEQQILEDVFHGGYTHANRYYIEETVTGKIICYDIASSYPFRMLADKFPMENFAPIEDMTVDDILDSSEEYAFYFKLKMSYLRLKDGFYPMPVLQFSKTTHTINPILDNGRILCASYAELWITEQDLKLIMDQYSYEDIAVDHVMCAMKGYLPNWYRDYVYECFEQKTRLKGGDPVAYSLAKAKVNSLYGMMVQKPVKEDITENYDFYDGKEGELPYNIITDKDMSALYDTWKDKKTSILLYQWGVWVTAYALKALFDLGSCVDPSGVWIYSDTDSVYATAWDRKKLIAYNEDCKKRLKEAGYEGVLHNGRECFLGIAEKDGEYSEFKTTGAKRYTCRYSDSTVNDPKVRGKLKITVAGVPKAGVKCLDDDINNFKVGLRFPGSTTGKKQHTYFYNEIYTDPDGNITGDSIDLSPCDYLLDATEVIPNWELLFNEDVEIQLAGGIEE